MTTGSASRWASVPPRVRLQLAVLWPWNRVPTASTRSASARISWMDGLVVSAPRHSGWSSGIEPRPSTVVTTGAPRRSASAVSAGPAPALITPPPAHSTGRVAADRASASFATASASGAVGVRFAPGGGSRSRPPVLLVDRDLHRAGLGPAREDVFRHLDDGPADVLGAAHRLPPPAPRGQHELLVL